MDTTTLHLKLKIESNQFVGFTQEIGRVSCRQDARTAYVRDGTIYAFRREILADNTIYGRDCRPIVTDAAESLTIDEEEHWIQAEQALTMGANYSN